MTLTKQIQNEDRIISHDSSSALDMSNLVERLKKVESRVLSIKEELKLLHQLNEFELGRFLLANKGLNGYWTAYLILHGQKKSNLNELESWLLNNAPIARATRQRFYIFKEQVQKYTRNKFNLASIPCGLMDDLLEINYDGKTDITLNGLDLDVHSLNLAQKNAIYHNMNNCSFELKDAWNLDIAARFDLITSNGLNVYEKCDKKVTELYRQFNKALKSNGILITSFLTPPPSLTDKSPWKNYSHEDVLKQKAIFADIIQVQWQVFRTHETTYQQLESSGFKVLEVIEDEQGMFPTVVAQKI